MLRRIRWSSFLACFLLLMLLSACQSSQVVMNAPLAQGPDHQPLYGVGYRLPAMIHDPRGEMLVALAFSGGGKRSAAFAHGVLRGMRDIEVVERGHRRTLLDEVDFIAGVSGGSFPAMHYGLYRDKSFDTFTDDFLHRDINAYIWGTYLLPWNWEWLVNPLFGTNDWMAAVYDRLMFHGATYADLMRLGLPVISVNATDIANGVSFAFTQPTFDQLCSDLSRYPVANAVAASNGFPVLFSPITLVNHRTDCGPTVPPEIAAIPVAGGGAEQARRVALRRLATDYLDGDRTRYVHLMDGGIADNLAMRSLLNMVIATGDDAAAFRRVALPARRILLISVDGQSATDPRISQERVVTGLGQIFSAVSGTQIDAYNFETLLLARQQVGDFVDRVRSLRCSQARVIDGHDCADVKGDLVHLSLNDVSDAAERQRLQSIPTGLTIPNEDSDALVEWGARIVQQNPTIRALLTGLDQTRHD